VSKKKGKFDLTSVVHKGYLKDGELLYFVSDAKKYCKIQKFPNGEYKVLVGEKVTEWMTVHQFATRCLGIEPPDHATKWLRTAQGKVLFDIWHEFDEAKKAA
jgi:hypothetical protein